MTVSDRIRKVYRESGLKNYLEFAQEIGVSKSTIDKWVGGKVLPEHKNLKVIAKVFNVNEEWLLFGVQEISGEDKVNFVLKLKEAELQNEIEFLRLQLQEKSEYIEMLKEEIRRLKKEK